MSVSSELDRQGRLVASDQPASTLVDTAAAEKGKKPFVSVVVPAYNEAQILPGNLASLCAYMDTLDTEYAWEMVIVNDGSGDATGEVAEAFARTRDNVRVLHHVVNFGLGQALQTAFNQCRGDYIVTMDADLSYSPEHIGRLLHKIQETRARVVVASPYMPGGRVSNVPRLRHVLSSAANHFLSLAAKGHLSTLTGMVRVYDRRFLRSLALNSTGMEVNPEIVYKTLLLKGRIAEIPGHLDWRLQHAHVGRRRPSMRFVRHTVSILLSGFLFRPVMFFIVPGLLVLFLSLYANAWLLIHFLSEYQRLSHYAWIPSRASAAVAAAFAQAPHTFVVGGLTLVLGIQLIGLGILALQSKSYFEQVFYLGTTILKSTRERNDE